MGCFAGAYVQDLRFSAKISDLKRQHSDQLKAVSDQAQKDTAAALQRTKNAQAAAELDKQKTEELANAKAENDRLRADVAAGTRRVRIAAANLATCQLTAGRGAGGGGVGDAVQIDLTPEGGRAVLDLRESTERDNTVIEYLQDYVKKVVKQCKR
ncbi:TPA: lysis protein [Serratia marcescens]|nr:lysis protein [Serratia marcescens]